MYKLQQAAIASRKQILMVLEVTLAAPFFGSGTLVHTHGLLRKGSNEEIVAYVTGWSDVKPITASPCVPPITTECTRQSTYYFRGLTHSTKHIHRATILSNKQQKLALKTNQRLIWVLVVARRCSSKFKAFSTLEFLYFAKFSCPWCFTRRIQNKLIRTNLHGCPYCFKRLHQLPFPKFSHKYQKLCKYRHSQVEKSDYEGVLDHKSKVV